MEERGLRSELVSNLTCFARLNLRDLNQEVMGDALELLAHGGFAHGFGGREASRYPEEHDARIGSGLGMGRHGLDVESKGRERAENFPHDARVIGPHQVDLERCAQGMALASAMGDGQVESFNREQILSQRIPIPIGNTHLEQPDKSSRKVDEAAVFPVALVGVDLIGHF